MKAEAFVTVAAGEAITDADGEGCPDQLVSPGTDERTLKTRGRCSGALFLNTARALKPTGRLTHTASTTQLPDNNNDNDSNWNNDSDDNDNGPACDCSGASGDDHDDMDDDAADVSACSGDVDPADD